MNLHIFDSMTYNCRMLNNFYHFRCPNCNKLSVPYYRKKLNDSPYSRREKPYTCKLCGSKFEVPHFPSFILGFFLALIPLLMISVSLTSYLGLSEDYGMLLAIVLFLLSFDVMIRTKKIVPLGEEAGAWSEMNIPKYGPIVIVVAFITYTIKQYLN